MIDFHSHIISGMDDGAKNEEISLELLSLAATSGTKKIVATPHYYLGRYEAKYEKVKREVGKLNLLVKRKKIPIEIYYGQEIFYTKYIIRQYEEGIIGTINNTRYMLLELSLHDFNIEEVINDLYELQLKGIVPILAHPERYRCFLKNPEKINAFIEEGFLFQLNTTSIDGAFGKNVKALAERYIENNIYSVFGSDAHDLENRSTNMAKGVYLLHKKCPIYFENLQSSSVDIIKNNQVFFEGSKIKNKKSFFNLYKK